jgi:hypothetical protein
MIKILSQDSVDSLRSLVKADVDVRESAFDTLVEEHRLRLIDVEYDIDETHKELVLPTGATQAENADTPNCIQIGNYLPTLSAAQATDERLWVTLCLRDFSDYVAMRWPKPNHVTQVKHIGTHWFSTGIRGRMRNNGVGRLWWYQHFCKKVSGKNLEEVFEVLFENSDYRSTILERSSSASYVNVTTAILEITSEAYANGISFNRDKFRAFMKRVNFLATRSRLGALDAPTLKVVLNPLYLEAYGQTDT